MTSKSMIWTTNNTGDGPTAGYATDRWQEMLRTLSTIDPTLYYIVLNRGGEYAVSGTVSPVTVQAGEAWVNGRYANDDASQTVAVPTPTTATRIDRIILRSDGTAQTIRVVRLAGVEGSGTPPTLTQNSTTYEVSLAKVTITTGGAITLVDERGWLGVRGVVDATTLEWDTSGKKIRIKDAGVTTAKIADGNVTTVKILDANVTTAKIADNAVTTAKILDANVTTAKILDANVTTAKIADANVTNVKLASGIDGSKITSGTPSVAGLTNAGNETVGGNSTVTGQIISNKVGHGTAAGVWVSSSKPALGLYETDSGTDERSWDLVADGKVLYLRSLNDVGSSGMNVFSATRSTGVQLANITFPPDVILEKSLTVAGAFSVSGAVSLPNGSINTAELADANVTTVKIADLNITTAKIADANVTTAKVADSAITAIKLASDAVTTVKILDANVTTAKIADGAITLAKHATDSVDDTIVGNRVLQFFKRQGGSATDWNSAGTGTQTPGMVRGIGGSISVTMSAEAFKAVSVTFPTGFSAKPLVFATCEGTSISGVAVVSSITSSGCTLTLYSTGGVQTGTFNMHWIAIGTE